MTPLDDGQDVHDDDGFNPGAGITPINHTAAPGIPTLDPSLKDSIKTKLRSFSNDPNLPEKMAEIAGLLHEFFSLTLEERIRTGKTWVKQILHAVGIEEQPFLSISDKQYADHAFALATFIQERQYMMMKVPDQLSSPSTPTAKSTPFSPSDQFAALDRRLGSMARSGGDLPPPLMNRRSTDPKTPPTQAPTDTNTVKQTQGPLTLLHSFLSKIMPTKSDQASQVDPQQAASSSNADKPQDRSNSPRFK